MADQNPKHPEGPKIALQIDPATEGGHYTNFMSIIHQETEFLFDFGMIMPGRPAIKIVSRIIASPRHAKQFLWALEENIRKYEEHFGPIKAEKPTLPPFQGPEPTTIN